MGALTRGSTRGSGVRLLGTLDVDDHPTLCVPPFLLVDIIEINMVESITYRCTHGDVGTAAGAW